MKLPRLSSEARNPSHSPGVRSVFKPAQSSKPGEVPTNAPRSAPQLPCCKWVPKSASSLDVLATHEGLSGADPQPSLLIAAAWRLRPGCGGTALPHLGWGIFRIGHCLFYCPSTADSDFPLCSHTLASSTLLYSSSTPPLRYADHATLRYASQQCTPTPYRTPFLARCEARRCCTPHAARRTPSPSCLPS